uniref:RING-type E3 ubiquitin transferase n=1 Tax=Crocodylus porosus TaxID=8502 RepID=A0A7M4EMC1_CROPO
MAIVLTTGITFVKQYKRNMKRGGQLKKQTNKCNVKKHNHLVKLYGCIYSPTNANILWIRQSQSIGMPHVSRWWQPPLDDCSGHGYYCLVVQWCLLPSCSGGPLEDSKASIKSLKLSFVWNADSEVQKDGKEQTSENTFKCKKKSQERRNLIQSSKLNLRQKGPDRDKNMENVFIQAQQSSAQSSAPTLQGTSGSFLSHQSSGPSPTSTRKAPLKFRDENIYSMLCFNMEDTYEENDSRKEEEILEEEFISFSLNKSPTPLEQARLPCRTSLVQDKQFNSEEVRDDKNVLSRRTESSHQPLRKLSITDSAVEQFSPGQRKSGDNGKSCAPYRCFFEDMASDKNENETLSLSSRNSQTENKLDGTSISENLNNASADVSNREWQSYESNPRRYADLLTSARATSHQPLFYSAYRTPRSLIRSLHGAEASANLSSTTALPQVLDLDGTSRFNVHRPLSPIRSRESFSAVESYDSSPILNPPEESTSPSAPSHDEENLLNSQSSFISLDSTNPILFQSDFTACLYMAGIQHDQLSLALLAMSDLHNQNNAVSNITPSHSPSHSKEIKKPSTDPENILYFFICVFSLLEEDSEEEGDQCRICQIAGGSITNPLLEPCSCVGSLQYVHQECLKSWLKAKIKSGADLETIKNCELCKQSLVVELGDFNVSDYYRNHQQSQVRNVIYYYVLKSARLDPDGVGEAGVSLTWVSGGFPEQQQCQTGRSEPGQQPEFGSGWPGSGLWKHKMLPRAPYHFF